MTFDEDQELHTIDNCNPIGEIIVKPAQKANSYLDRQINEWTQRVFYDVRFKEDTTADLDQLREIQDNILQKFTVIASSSEVSVYKIGRFFIENGISNDLITFIDGRMVQAYITRETPSEKWKSRSLIDKFFNIYKKDIKNKLLFIPLLQNEFDILTAIYFTTQLQANGALGMVFYSEGPNNLAEILIEGTDIKVFEFPETVYHVSDKKILVDDGF